MCVPRGVEGDECHPFSHKVCDCVGVLGGSPIIRHHALTLCLAHLFSELLEVGEMMIWPDIKALAQ